MNYNQIQQLLNYQQHQSKEIEQQQNNAKIYEIIYNQIYNDKEFTNFFIADKLENKENIIYGNKKKKNQILLKFSQSQNYILCDIHCKEIKYQITFNYCNILYKVDINKIKLIFLNIQKFIQLNQDDTKVYFKKGFFNISFKLYISLDCKNEFLIKCIKNKMENISSLIQLFEEKVHSFFNKNYQDYSIKLNNSLKFQSKLQIKDSLNNFQNNKPIRLLQQFNILELNQQEKTVSIQFLSSNSLFKAQYINYKTFNPNSLELLKSLRTLESQINRLVQSYDQKFQVIYSNLFSQLYLECQNNDNYEFQEYTKLTDHINRFPQQQETFENRIQLLIQILCIYLLKNDLNLDSLFPQEEVILVDSKQQIKLDMFKYLEIAYFKSHEIKQELNNQDCLKYFEIFLPKREKKIIIDNYDLSNELQNLKYLIRTNQISLKILILNLITIQDLLRYKIEDS